jgi:NAD(P)-dependent dehydrogenase (short-subunit alcohol dehydrogenase family)
MDLKDKVVVVTGGGRGIGAALARRFSAAGARAIVVADLNGSSAETVAREVGGLAIATDVGRAEEIDRLVAQAIDAFGRIDLFCSNAGIETGGGVDTPFDAWQRMLGVNVLSHVYAARAVLPGMIAQGAGYLLQTVSAAGLLTQMSSLPYSVTKHAAIGLAEWLAITYGKAGIKVSCICPLGVRTDMLMGVDDPVAVHLRENAIDAEQVAEAAIAGLAEERFLILPHPEVAEFFHRKADDYDRWLRGMQRLRDSLPGMPPPVGIW